MDLSSFSDMSVYYADRKHQNEQGQQEGILPDTQPRATHTAEGQHATARYGKWSLQLLG